MPLKMRAACDQTRVSSALLLGSYPKVSPRTSRLDSSLSILWPGSHAKPPVIDQVSRRRWQTGWRVLLNVLNTPAVAPKPIDVRSVRTDSCWPLSGGTKTESKSSSKSSRDRNYSNFETSLLVIFSKQESRRGDVRGWGWGRGRGCGSGGAPKNSKLQSGIEMAMKCPAPTSPPCTVGELNSRLME